jgi:hypothetical protein
VRRRLAEGRGDELVVLRTVSFAAANGATVGATQLRLRLNWDEPRFACALARLVEEHAIRQRSDGALGGLHEIRSTHLDSAVRTMLRSPIADVVADVVHVLQAHDFGPFIARLLKVYPEAQEPLLNALAARMSGGNASDWSAILHGLGLATADRIAEQWLEIARAEEIEDRSSSIMFGMALVGASFGDDSRFAKYREALAAFQGVEVPDLREMVLSRLPRPLNPVLPNIHAFHRLAASMLPLRGGSNLPEFSIRPPTDVATAGLTPLLETLRTLRELGLEPARGLVKSTGGEDALLDRMWHEIPWTTRPIRSIEDGKACVRSDLRYIHPSIQPDVNADVVRVCELISAADPQAELIISNAIGPDGEPSGLGEFKIATKRMPRSAVPAPARIAWTRAQLRAIDRLVGAPNETGRTTSLASAIRELAEKVREAGDFFCRMEAPSPRWRLFLQVRTLLTDFVPPPPAFGFTADPLALGGLSSHDDMHGFVSGLERLCQALASESIDQPVLAAARVSTLAETAEQLANPDRWRMTGNPPLEELAIIQKTLLDIRAVLGDIVKVPERRRSAALRFGTSSRRHSILPRAAGEARERAAADINTERERIVVAFNREGLTVEVYWRERSKDDGWTWPAVDYIALLPVTRLLDWFQSEAKFRSAAEGVALGTRLYFASLMNGYVPPFAMLHHLSVLPRTEIAREWLDHLPYRFVEDDPLRLYSEIMDAIITISTIANEKQRQLLEIEGQALQKFIDVALEKTKIMTELAATHNNDGVLVEVCAFLGRTGDRLQGEVATPTTEDIIASDALRLMHGQLTDFGAELIFHRLALIERAIQLS